MARKPLDEIAFEFDSMKKVEGVDQYYFYSVGSYNENRKGMEYFLDRVADTPLKSISYEQYHLTPDDILKRMADSNRRTTITLSPESHDLRISKLAGRGVYTNEELEAWLDRALEAGISQIDIWYFIGMPEQDEKSVMGTLEYCERLLQRFKGKRVNPMLCPMIPFLDPASTFFEYPDKHGYTVFYRTVEEHRRGMERASIINRTNYETRWLNRKGLVEVGYTAIRRLMEMKAESGSLPHAVVEGYNDKLDDALKFIMEVHDADCIEERDARARELEGLGDEIVKRNNSVLFSGVMNQAAPINRQIGGRWFDELGWDAAALEAASKIALVGVPAQKPTGSRGVGSRSMFPLQHL